MVQEEQVQRCLDAVQASIKELVHIMTHEWRLNEQLQVIKGTSRRAAIMQEREGLRAERQAAMEDIHHAIASAGADRGDRLEALVQRILIFSHKQAQQEYMETLSKIQKLTQ